VSADQPAARDQDVSVLGQVSKEMVRVYKEQFGRGPMSSRAEWCGRDVLLVVLEDTLTAPERNLAALGEHQRLRDMRTFMQYVNVARFCDPIERLTGRTVRAFISGIDTAVDGLSTETFVLYPAGTKGVRSRAAMPVAQESGPRPAAVGGPPPAS
jgi:uncharacterized protein YbcI